MGLGRPPEGADDSVAFDQLCSPLLTQLSIHVATPLRDLPDNVFMEIAFLLALVWDSGSEKLVPGPLTARGNLKEAYVLVTGGKQLRVDQIIAHGNIVPLRYPLPLEFDAGQVLEWTKDSETVFQSLVTKEIDVALIFAEQEGIPITVDEYERLKKSDFHKDVDHQQQRATNRPRP